jgi:hypothetical protein
MKPVLATGRALVVLALVVMTGLAAWERWRGIGMMLPHATQMDEHIALRQLDVFRGADNDAESDRFYALYPHLVSRTALLLPTDGGGAARPGMGLEEHLERARTPWLEVRAAAALLSLGIVPGTYWLARVFLAPGWSLLAAAFAVTSLLHAAFTQLARPHGPVTTFILLTVVASIHLRRHPSPRWYLLAGLSAALAIGSLHSGIFALGPLLVAHVLRSRGMRRRSRWSILGSLGLVAASVPIFYPFYIEAAGRYLRVEDSIHGASINLSGQPLFLSKFNGAGFPVIVSTFATYDPLLFVVALAGLALVLVRLVRRPVGREARLDVAIVLAHAVPYTIVIGLYEETWERFMIQLLPYAGILAAVAVRALAMRLAPDLGQRFAKLSVALALLLLALPVAAMHRLGTVRSAADTQQLAADWIRRELSPGEDRLLTVPVVDLPLLHARGALGRNAAVGATYWIDYQAALSAESFGGDRYQILLPGEVKTTEAAILADARGWLHANRPDYVLFPSGPADPDGPALHRVRHVVQSEGERVARFSPERDDRGEDTMLDWRYLDAPWNRPLVRRLFEAARMGFTLEIYRLRREPPPR